MNADRATRLGAALADRYTLERELGRGGMATVLTFAVLLTLPDTAPAQETTGGVRGRLHSAVTGPVPNAQITATSPHLLGERRALSATDGVFQFLLLPPGTYTLRVRAIGHRPLLIQDVQVQLGRITGLGDVPLAAAAIELGELTVTAPTATLDPVRTTMGATLTAEDLAALPAERDYKSAIAILPHVNTSYHGDPVNVGGSTGLENMYFIDGVNVTSELTAATGTTLPYNFVRAVEIKAGGYEAEYGKALGAVVNAITYSGTNTVEGHVFGFFAHDALSAATASPPVLRETGFVSYDVGARVSGPLLRDRLWFSAAYNPRVDRVDKEIPGLGVHTDETVAHIFAGRLTWDAAPRTTVEFSLFGDPTRRREVSVPSWLASHTAMSADPLLARLESGGVTSSLRVTTRLGAALTLEAAFARSHGQESRLAETEAGATQPHYVDFVASTIEGGIGAISEGTRGRTSGALRATLVSGRHTVVGGLEYEDSRVSQARSFSGGTIVTRDDSSMWNAAEESSSGTFHNRVPTAYLQDGWRLSDRVTVNAGLRWSGQFLSGASGTTVQRFPDEWQPRIGFSWQTERNGTQRVFGSYGRFYQQIPLFMASLWYVDLVAIYSTYSADPRQPGAVPDAVLDASTSESDWAQSIDGLAVENFAEFTLGYERLLGGAGRLTIRGIRRDLRSSFQWGIDPSSERLWVLGTPGKGAFAFLPPPKREYTALEVSLDGSIGRFDYRTSYVLSRTWGNYSGLYGSDFNVAWPGGNGLFFAPWHAVNSTGPLPNDRPHVFKVTTEFRPLPSLAIGTFFSAASGIPQNRLGASPVVGSGWTFLARRGSAGRTPTLWDFNFRLLYDLPIRHVARARAVLDLLHVGNARQAVEVDEIHSFATDANGQPSNLNPSYLQPTDFAPPMAARLGLEVRF